nr:PREDICTED: uncharacterized protein LOC108221124 [Daucus carota subsp. sativus]
MTFATIHSPVLSLTVRASVDIQQRISYTPHRTIPKNPKPTATPSPPTTTTTSSPNLSVSDLLSRPEKVATQVPVSETSSFMGYDAWLPTAPKVEKPRSVYNAASLAFIGDCIYELYARRNFLFPPLNIEEYNDRVMAVVRCEAQVCFTVLKLCRCLTRIQDLKLFAIYMRLKIAILIILVVRRLMVGSFKLPL